MRLAVKRAVAQLHGARRGRESAPTASNNPEEARLVSLLLEMLRARVGGASFARSHRLLCCVLANAASKGHVDEKYLRLLARNVKVWEELLQHAEVVGILELAGFEHRGAQALAREELELAQVGGSGFGDWVWWLGFGL